MCSTTYSLLGDVRLPIVSRDCNAQQNMVSPITLLTTHVFNKTQTIVPSGCVLTDVSRGIDKPDRLRIAHTTQKNPVEPTSVDTLSVVSLQYSYVNADGVLKYVQYSVNRRCPDDCPAADDTAAFNLLMDYYFSAKTDRASNIADIKNGAVV